MMKRKTHFALPVTQQDDAALQKSYSSGRRAKPTRPSRMSDVVGLLRYLTILIALGLFVVGVQRIMVHRRSGGHLPLFPHYRPKEDDVGQQRQLKEFGSLQYALDNSQLVALYFAASWCPQSTPVSVKLDEVLSDILLPPPPSDPSPLPQRHGLSLVYISSDRNEVEYNDYLKDRPHWMAIPFDSVESAGIKRHFHTWAKRELAELQMERQHEIPTLVVVDGETHQVLTFSGVKDVMELGATAVDEWFGLARISQALDRKFDSENEEEKEYEEEEEEEEHSAEDVEEEEHESMSRSGSEGV